MAKQKEDIHSVYNTGDVLIPQTGSQLLEFMAKNPNSHLEIVVKGHSEPQFRLLMSYARWAWGDYFRDQIPSFDNFRKEISKEVGWVTVDDYINLKGERVREISAKSWSPNEKTRGDSAELVRLVSEFIFDKTGIDLETWKSKRTEFITSTPQ